MFPNLFVASLPTWATIMPTFDGVTPQAIPPFPASFPGLEGIALYIQTLQLDAATLALSSGSFSRGLTLINREPTAGFRETPSVLSAAAQHGQVMASGDLSGDGIDDLVVSAPGSIAGGFFQAGRVLIYLGSPNGLEAHPYVIEEPDVTGQMIGFQAPPGVETGADPGVRFGESLAVGNLDADPEAELVVGAPSSNGLSGEVDSGEAYVFSDLTAFFQSTPLTAPQLINMTALATAAIPLRPPQNVPQAARTIGDRFGSAFGIGDVNGDGVGDLVVTSPFKDSAPAVGATIQNCGLAYLFLGPITASGFPNPYRNADVVFGDDLVGPYENFGIAVAISDIDGDNQAEIAIGTPGSVGPRPQQCGQGGPVPLERRRAGAQSGAEPHRDGRAGGCVLRSERRHR